MFPYIFAFASFPATLKPLILWLLGRQPPPLHLLRTADPGWWTRLREHRLFPLLYYRLQQAGGLEVLPPETGEYLKQDYAASLSLLLRREAETRRRPGSEEFAGFEAILLKGADLRLRVYENPALRPMTDLDLLISPETLGAVRALLRDIGYTLLIDSVNPRPGFRERYRVGLHFLGPPPVSLMVDLHWELEAVASYYRLPFARLAPQAQTLNEYLAAASQAGAGALRDTALTSQTVNLVAPTENHSNSNTNHPERARQDSEAAS